MASISVCAEDERCSDSTKDLTNVALMEAAAAHDRAAAVGCKRVMLIHVGAGLRLVHLGGTGVVHSAERRRRNWAGRIGLRVQP
jgi:hypothetical protein